MKDNIKHVSFDLWLTIINSNPEFKKFLIKFWAYELFITEEKSTKLLRDMKHYFVKVDEITGRHSTLAEQFYYLYCHAEIPCNKEYVENRIQKLYPQIEKAFLAIPPVLYDDNTKMVLETLKEKGITTNILSNTGIIQGSTLTKALELLGISDLFNYKIYSDEVSLAKPNLDLFYTITTYPRYINLCCEILHVGDNYIADGGCTKVGINYLQINSNENSILKVLDYV